MKRGTRVFILKKALELLLTLLIVTMISFILMQLSPIDAAEAYARRNAFAIMLHHALPQAVSGLLPNFMQMMGLCMAGSMIVERIFSLPGLGYLIIDSVLYRDNPMIHATILFLAFSLVFFNIVSDVIQRVLRGGGREVTA